MFIKQLLSQKASALLVAGVLFAACGERRLPWHPSPSPTPAPAPAPSAPALSLTGVDPQTGLPF